MILTKTLPINKWAKRFATLPVTTTEQIDANSVKQTTFWLESYWQRVTINKADRSLKTIVLSVDAYRSMWVLETCPHVVARSTLINTIEFDSNVFTQNFVDLLDGKTDGRSEFEGMYPILETMKELYTNFIDSGLIGAEVVVKATGSTIEQFEYNYLMRVLEQLPISNEFSYSNILTVLLDSPLFREGNFKHKADYLQSMINEERLRLVVIPRTQEKFIEVLHKNKTVDRKLPLNKEEHA